MIETRVDGEPSDLRAAAAYLGDVVGPGVDRLADRVGAQRAAMAGAWRGAAGDAFADRAASLTHAGDGVGAAVRAIGREVDALAGVLDAVQAGMAAVRARARAAGLDVVGTVISEPAATEAFTVPLATAGPTPVVAYLEAREHADGLRHRWTAAMTAAADLVASQQVTVAQVTRDLLSGGYSAFLRARMNPVLHGQAQFLTDEAARAVDDLARLQADMRHGRIDVHTDLYDDIDDLKHSASVASVEAEEYVRRAERWANVETASTHLGRVLAVYGVYDDVRSGESLVQAAASQGSAYAAGATVAAWTARGALTGSIAPGVGTLAGAAAGAAAGIFVNHAVDRRFEDAREDERRAAEERAQERARDERRIRSLVALQHPDPWRVGPDARSTTDD